MGSMIKSQARRILNTCIWSWAGWRTAWSTEASLRQWTMICVLSCALAVWFDFSRGETALIVALSLLVVASELMNTAIERTVDLVTTQAHPLAQQAKDTGSACVALTAIAAGMVWCVLLFG